MGADLCLNYKAPTFYDDLVRATPDFVDVFFGEFPHPPSHLALFITLTAVADNVGGTILDSMLKRMNMLGRVAACGTIANYNRDADVIGLKNFM